MRLPYSRIYRAFPELDRYTDVQCARFVDAACRSGWRRHAHRVLLAALFLGAAVVCLLVFARLLAPAEGWLRRVWRAAPEVVAWIPAAFGALLAPALATLLARDFLLIRRIRYVLRFRGVCPLCRYSLVGLPIPPGNVLTCPECGHESDVDPSLSELTRNEIGECRLTPGVVAEPSQFWTARRRRLARQAAMAAAVLFLVVLPLCWGGYELFLARQAAAARKDRPRVSGLMAYVEANQPPGVSAADANAWDAFFHASARRAAIDAAIRPPEAEYSADGRLIQPDFDLLDGEWRRMADPDDVAYLGACEAAAARYLAAYEEAGLFDDLREVASRRRAVRPLDLAPGAPVIEAVLPELGESRQFARMAVARMRRARAAGDIATFVEAFETALALARINDQQPFQIQALVGAAIEGLALAEARACLAAAPSLETLDAIEGALARQRLGLPAEYHIEGERLSVLDAIGWFFEEPSRVRFGQYSASRVQFLFGIASIEGPLGTYTANRSAIDAHFTALRASARTAPRERGASPAVVPIPDLALPRTLLSWPAAGAAVRDKRELDLRAMSILIALERHRIARGAYPASLGELTPPLPPEVIEDPWSGSPLIYKLRQPEIAGAERHFLLYSVGADGVDNGGQAHPEAAARALRAGEGAYDYPLHDVPATEPKR
ncbi:MAG TPA: hypothetical protein VFF69_12470 [Phycisphaerales bacterium]|nr:hypothetical protein [Phycisphaerales bacterium]